jgi:hypothetical protein
MNIWKLVVRAWAWLVCEEGEEDPESKEYVIKNKEP